MTAPSLKTHKDTLPGKPFYAWTVCLLAATFYCYQFILRVFPNVMTEDLMTTFAGQGCTLGLLVAFYYNAYAGMQIPVGMLLDRLGPRRLISFSCTLAACGTLIFAASSVFATAALGRLFMGLGAACGFIGTLKLATLWFPVHHVGRVIGVTMVLGTLGATFAGAPLGWIIEVFGWRKSLLGIALIGFCLALILYTLVRDRPHDGISQRDTSSKETFSKFSWLDGFITVIRCPQSWLIGAYGSLMYVPLSAVADLWGTPYIAELFQIDRKLAASIVSLIYIGVALGSPITVFLSDRLGSRKIPMALSAFGSLLIYSVVFYLDSVPIGLMYGLMFLGGLCFTGQNLIFAMTAERTPLKASGVALGFTNMIVMLSGVIFEPLVGFLLDSHAQGSTEPLKKAAHFSLSDFRFALLPIPLCLFAALVILYFIKETYPRSLKQGSA